MWTYDLSKYCNEEVWSAGILELEYMNYRYTGIRRYDIGKEGIFGILECEKVMC